MNRSHGRILRAKNRGALAIGAMACAQPAVHATGRRSTTASYLAPFVDLVGGYRGRGGLGSLGDARRGNTPGRPVTRRLRGLGCPRPAQWLYAKRLGKNGPSRRGHRSALARRSPRCTSIRIHPTSSSTGRLLPLAACAHLSRSSQPGDPSDRSVRRRAQETRACVFVVFSCRP